MGQYVKVYLNDVHHKGLLEWQRQKSEENPSEGVPALNALMNEALRNELFEAGILEEHKMGSLTGVRLVKSTQ